MQIYLAPMEGITGYVYRNALNKHYGGVDKYFTPFLANKNFNHKDLNDIIPEHNQGIHLVPQVLTNQAEVFLTITEHLEAFGYEEVNMNLGCPSGTVVSKKRGAGFLSVPDQLDSFLEEIFSASKLPISIKTRIGMDNPEEWDRILSVYEKYPMTELIIHPRLQKEFYKGKAHFEAYLEACDRMKMPLCYNGDIVSESSFNTFKKMAAGKSFDRIMIGRGAIANPALARELSSHNQEKGNEDSIIALEVQKELPVQRDDTECAEEVVCDEKKIFRAFHEDILNGYKELMSGDQPVLFKMKELWVYMGPYRNISEKDMKKLHKSKSLAEYNSIVERLY